VDNNVICTALAIIALTVIEIVNLYTLQYDGVMLNTIVAIIAGLGGYSISRSVETRGSRSRK